LISVLEPVVAFLVSLMKGFVMKVLSSNAKKFFIVNKHHIQIIVTLACLILFVLAAGAPGGMGGVGMQSVDNQNTVGQCQMSMNALEHMSEQASLRLCGP
jgi:uncharacterized membrane protein